MLDDRAGVSQSSRASDRVASQSHAHPFSPRARSSWLPRMPHPRRSCDPQTHPPMRHISSSHQHRSSQTAPLSPAPPTLATDGGVLFTPYSPPPSHRRGRSDTVETTLSYSCDAYPSHPVLPVLPCPLQPPRSMLTRLPKMALHGFKERERAMPTSVSCHLCPPFDAVSTKLVP